MKALGLSIIGAILFVGALAYSREAVLMIKDGFANSRGHELQQGVAGLLLGLIVMGLILCALGDF